MKNFNENYLFPVLSALYKYFNSAFSLFVAYMCFSSFLVVLIFESGSMATLLILYFYHGCKTGQKNNSFMIFRTSHLHIGSNSTDAYLHTGNFYDRVYAHCTTI